MQTILLIKILTFDTICGILTGKPYGKTRKKTKEMGIKTDRSR
jgi:hypothetical protein